MFAPHKRKDFPCLFEYRFACNWKIRERASNSEIIDNEEINHLILIGKATQAILVTVECLECNFWGKNEIIKSSQLFKEFERSLSSLSNTVIWNNNYLRVASFRKLHVLFRESSLI